MRIQKTFFPIVLTSVLLIPAIHSFSFNFEQSFFYKAVNYLASEELEGRKPGTAGDELAKKYIEDEFKKHNIAPLTENYRQEFTIFTGMEKNGPNFLQAFSEDGTLFEEALFQPLSYSLSSYLKNKPLVFAGFGISIPASDKNLTYDDYAGIDVQDKVVIIMSGDPGIGNKDSLFRKPEYHSYQNLYYKIKNAINHGAAGILVVNDPLSLPNYPEETTPHFNGNDGGGQRFSALSGLITNRWVNCLLTKKDLNTKKVQEKISQEQTPFSFEIEQKIHMKVSLKKNTGRVSNVVAYIPGTDPELKKQVIVLGAHFDHLGHGGESSMDRSQIGQIHPGADDNASGTAMVLSLAQLLSQRENKHSYVFALFNAEEVGLLGSRHFVSSWARHTEDKGSLYAMLNFDMIGRFQNEVSVMGTGTAKDWGSILKDIPSPIPFVAKRDALGASDHASFTEKNIPALFFTTGAHEDYHRVSDTPEKIQYQAMENIKSYAFALIKKMDDSSTLTFDENYNNSKPDQGRQRGYGAHLGCVPKFGQSDDIKGVVCTRTSADSPAMKAGVIAGDILIRIGDIDIKSVYDLAFALKYYRAGDEVEIEWKRDEKNIKAQITLAKSKR